MSPTADSVEDVDLPCIDLCLQAFQPFYIIAANKDIHMLPNLAGFSQDAVAESPVPQPERIENVADGREIVVESDLGLAVGERFEISAEMNNDSHK